MKSSILLISSPYSNESDILVHYTEPIRAFLENIPVILFIPYATERKEWDANTQKARVFFNSIGIAVLGIHQVPQNWIFTDFKAVFICDGDTAMLVDELQSQNLLTGIRDSILSGKMSYIGVNVEAILE